MIVDSSSVHTTFLSLGCLKKKKKLFIGIDRFTLHSVKFMLRFNFCYSRIGSHNILFTLIFGCGFICVKVFFGSNNILLITEVLVAFLLLLKISRF